MSDFQTLIPVDNAQILLKPFNFPSVFAIAFLPQPSFPAICSCCKKSIGDSSLKRIYTTASDDPKQPCTLVNMHTRQFACLDQAEYQKNMVVHVYHWRCLSDFVQNDVGPPCCILCYGQGILQISAPWLNHASKELPPIERLGVDIGGVIVSAKSSRRDEGGKISGAEDTSFFGENFLQTPPEPNCLLVLRRLVQERFGASNVFLISKSQPTNQLRTLQWLQNINFYAETGILPQNVYFCLQRKQKREICDRIRMNHFIDDRLEVLEAVSQSLSMKTTLLFGPLTDEYNSNPFFFSPSVTKAPDWNFVSSFFLTK